MALNANSESIENKKKSIGELTIDVDVSNALKGLKAVERQAKKTARALKEVERLVEDSSLQEKADAALEEYMEECRKDEN